LGRSERSEIGKRREGEGKERGSRSGRLFVMIVHGRREMVEVESRARIDEYR
jgi:hypothetical protein